MKEKEKNDRNETILHYFIPDASADPEKDIVSVKIFSDRPSKQLLLKFQFQFFLTEFLEKEKEIRHFLFYKRPEEIKIMTHIRNLTKFPMKRFTIQSFDSSGKKLKFISIKDGKFHSQMGMPSTIDYNSDGRVSDETYHQNGDSRGFDGVIARHFSYQKPSTEDDFIIIMEISHQGELEIRRNYAKCSSVITLTTETILKNGRWHCETGPANRVKIDDLGTMSNSYYYEGVFLGKELNLTTPEEIRTYYENMMILK